MTGRWLRRAGPWATPTLVVIEVVLVWSGLLKFGTAVLIGVLLEMLLWVTTASRMVAAGRRFRTDRTAGIDVWAAAQDGLAQLVPRRLAHLILLELRLWVSLGRWITGRHVGRPGRCSFRYDSGLRLLLWVVIGLVVVEGATLDLVLALGTAGSSWIWISIGVHVYAIGGLLGVVASFATRPHLLESDALRVRDGVFTELIVPYCAITAVRMVRTPNLGRSGLKIDEIHNAAMLAHGDATVDLALDPMQPLSAADGAVGSFAALSITVDAAETFIRALNGCRRPEGVGPNVGTEAPR